jgi:hypothetical protein
MTLTTGVTFASELILLVDSLYDFGAYRVYPPQSKELAA